MDRAGGRGAGGERRPGHKETHGDERHLEREDSEKNWG